jgi:protein gp37
MGDKSEIQWTDATWNPVTGCSKVSPGCAHCYAESLTRRFSKAWDVPDLPWTPENASENVILHWDRLDQPLRWKRPRMVFVNSMSDLFHEEVPIDFLARIWDVMVRAPRHTFQVLTKRPERIAEALGPRGIGFYAVEGPVPCPQPNIWIGTSIENRRYVHRADLLRKTPAAVRFISAEPLLGPLLAPECVSYQGERCGSLRPEYGRACRRCPNRGAGRWETELDLTDIDWLIVGGESGPGHRQMCEEWVLDLRDACLAQSPSYPSAFEVHMQPILAHARAEGLNAEAARTAFFFKQWGGATPKAGGRELDGRTWDEMPASREAVAA